MITEGSNMISEEDNHDQQDSSGSDDKDGNNPEQDGEFLRNALEESLDK